MQLAPRLRHAAKRAQTRAPYICLSCRLQSTQRQSTSDYSDSDRTSRDAFQPDVEGLNPDSPRAQKRRQKQYPKQHQPIEFPVAGQDRTLQLQGKEHYKTAFESTAAAQKDDRVSPIRKMAGQSTLEDGTVIREDGILGVTLSRAMLGPPQGSSPALTRSQKRTTRSRDWTDSRAATNIRKVGAAQPLRTLENEAIVRTHATTKVETGDLFRKHSVSQARVEHVSMRKDTAQRHKEALYQWRQQAIRTTRLQHVEMDRSLSNTQKNLLTMKMGTALSASRSEARRNMWLAGDSDVISTAERSLDESLDRDRDRRLKRGDTDSLAGLDVTITRGQRTLNFSSAAGQYKFWSRVAQAWISAGGYEAQECPPWFPQDAWHRPPIEDRPRDEQAGERSLEPPVPSNKDTPWVVRYETGLSGEITEKWNPADAKISESLLSMIDTHQALSAEMDDARAGLAKQTNQEVIFTSYQPFLPATTDPATEIRSSADTEDHKDSSLVNSAARSVSETEDAYPASINQTRQENVGANASYQPFPTATQGAGPERRSATATETEKACSTVYDNGEVFIYQPIPTVTELDERRTHSTTTPVSDNSVSAAKVANETTSEAATRDALSSTTSTRTTTRSQETSPNTNSAPSYFPFSSKRPMTDMSAITGVAQHHARLMHYSRSARQQAAAAVDVAHETPFPAAYPSSKQPDIRTRLRQWQDLHGNKEEDRKQDEILDDDPDSDGFSNATTRLPGVSSSRGNEITEEDERQAQAHFMNSEADEVDNGFDTRTLQMGDLVELEYLNQDRESVIAVFVRRVTATEGQFFTMSGRWTFAADRLVPYSIPGWVSPKAVEPLLEYLPIPKTSEEREKLMQQAYAEDLSVPRGVAGPLVNRMVQFWTESQEIYRNNASSLDNAHNILAHETDLRYGSLVSAATTLLQVPADSLPDTALFTVRAALTRAGFAFNIDRRSHRLTGYLQIRSKEQVKMVGYVRRWIRDWQDDLAKRAALQGEGDVRALRQLKTPNTAQYVYSFIDKVRKIVARSREDRQPTHSGTISPSKKRFPITIDQNSVKVTTDLQFSDQETEIVRFLEAWTCSTLFLGLPRLQSLPPLLLQATGLYEDFEMDRGTGWMFLQELGTIMPYENRVRFDQHLLLPSSQHSKPLQNLMANLLEMKDNPRFSDSMKGLRRDWGKMPVYCIDEASAQEIDDGLSIERAGANEWWVHVHVANPTAFFERDHPLAKMARHMGESLYMPERTYTMLPRWATLRHFSLAKDRPCLTYSVKLDSEGQIKEHKINSGFIRNAISLTKDEVQELIGQADTGPKRQKHTLTVGGELPPRSVRKSDTSNITYEQVQELKTLHMLAQKRSDIRRANGGVFYHTERPEVEVWQQWTGSGLAWDHPHRRGRRSVEGDPIIRTETREMGNHFSASSSPSQMMVQEMMLLAGEVSGMWCAERQIPALFRGTVRRPGLPDPDAFLDEILEPAERASPTGERPMHLGLDYLIFIGAAAMRTRPVKHKTLGLGHYNKVTSPLRRYGDMIAHWQIEAALREEARRGSNLVTQNNKADRSFLPFSSPVLETIMLGLQPREQMIMRSKMHANMYWNIMLMFRAFHYHECELPFYTPVDTTKPRMQVWVSNVADRHSHNRVATGVNVELNMPVAMYEPGFLGMEAAMRGDVWEAEIEMVDVQHRVLRCRPVRLVERPDVQSRGIGG
ncbi:3'-5' RNA exonuclease complex component [Extremus antarcticus]|uniref:3'-5' RNA exonuclease complex component n=1 Tax=Extremus antarcticus TaxID=702011 RepID=A0AAJ0DM18_9PEZI|nr:3'-5' RNA exonuclease complex component [Extremus antarcticus]